MAEPFIGQILTFAGNFVPLNYLACAGQTLPISQYDTLYNLIGTTYGGDGISSFNLPDLRGRIPIHQGVGPNLSPYSLGMVGGAESVTLIQSQLPAHNHPIVVVSGSASNSNTPSSAAVLGDMPANANAVYPYTPYASGGQVALAPQSVTTAGNSQPHENRQPVLAITYGIAVFGIYPTPG